MTNRAIVLFIFALCAGCAGCGGSSEAPQIIEFTASRTEINAGESVALSYSVRGAKHIEITAAVEGGMPSTLALISLEESEAPMGSFMTPALLQTSHVAIVASSGSQTASAELVITVHGAPLPGAASIIRFETSPAEIPVGGYANLVWSTANAFSGSIRTEPDNALVLSDIGLPSGSFLVGPQSTTTYVLSVEGSGGTVQQIAVLSVGTVMPPPDGGVINDGGPDGGIVTDGGVDTDGGTPIGPLAGIYAAPGAATVFNDALAIGEIDRYRIDVTTTAELLAEVFSPSVTSTTCTVDTLLRLYAADGLTLLGSDDDDGIDTCSRIDQNEAFARLAPGTYYLAVEEFGSDEAIPAYALRVEGVAPMGLNIVGTFALPGPALDYSGAISPIGEVDAFQITVTSTSYLVAESFVPAAGTCTNADPYFRLLAADGVTELGADDDDGIDRCSRIDQNDGFALLAPGTYFLTIEDLGNDELIPAYAIHLETGTATTAIPVDGIYAAPGVEVIFGGAIAVAGEIDRYRIDVATTVDLVAEVFSPSVTSTACAVDTILRLYASDGTTLLGSDDDDGIDTCSRIDQNDAFARLAPGTYYLAVEEYGDDAPIASYELRLTSTEVATFTVLGTYPAPGPQVIFGGAIAVAGEVDYYEIDVASTIDLIVDTFAPTVASGTCINADLTDVDTYVRLFAADGITELGSDDDDGVDHCSFFDQNDTFAHLLPGTYFLSVEEYGNDGVIPTYELRFNSL